MRYTAPIGAILEEAIFNLGAGASRNGVTLDTRDWFGSTMPDFADNRKFGFPLLDLAIRAPGNANVNVQYGQPAVVGAEPPALTWNTFSTTGAAAGAWTPLTLRITARFARVQVVDTSGAANNGIYLVYFARGV